MSTLPVVSRACAWRDIAYRWMRITHGGFIQDQQQHQQKTHHRLMSTSASDMSSSSFDAAAQGASANTSVLHAAPVVTTPESTTPKSNPTSRSIPTSRPQKGLAQGINTTSKILTGTVTRTGTMQSCIQVTYQTQKYNSRLQKHYTRPNRLLAHDPNPAGYLREGDVIEYSAWTADEKQARVDRKTNIEAQILADETRQIAEQEEALAAAIVAEQEAATSTQDASTKKAAKAHRVQIQQQLQQLQQQQKKRIRRMEPPKSKANHGTGEEKWVGSRYVVRRVVTPFGLGLDQRMEEVAQRAAQDELKVSVKGKRWSQSQVASVKIAA